MVHLLHRLYGVDALVHLFNKARKKHLEIFEIFQKYFVKYFMKYFRAKKIMKFYITSYSR